MSDVTKQIAYLERRRKRHQDELPFAQGYAERDDTQFVIDAYSAAIEALSHAAGQEAEFPECSGDPTDCPENEGHGCCKLKKGWCEKHSRHEPCESCTDKAKPSTSAEVGRDAARYRKLKPMMLSADFEPEDYVGLTFALPAGTVVMANLDSILDGIDAAIAASSGRQD